VHKTASACPNCGARLRRSARGDKSKIAAGLLALFLGGLGIHKFYLGRGGWGVLYLLFCWTFIPAIVAFFEAIILLTMSDDRFDEKYNA
jgi:TM2 domain-containing membrane protein YozV